MSFCCPNESVSILFCVSFPPFWFLYYVSVTLLFLVALIRVLLLGLYILGRLCLCPFSLELFGFFFYFRGL